MKAVILVGGEGTRLRPLTCNIPKAIVPVLNRPFLEHQLLYLRRHGVTDVILAMGYLPDPVRECLGNGSQLGVKLTYLVESSPMGTAGAVKNAGQLLDGPFLVLNGDIITGIDLSAMIAQHRDSGARVSIALTPVDNPTVFGVVETDGQGRVRRFLEKPGWDQVTTNLINAGIYMLEPEVLGMVPPSTRSMFERDVFPALVEAGDPVFAFPSDAYWIDIGTPEKYLQAHRDLLQGWGGEVRMDGKSQVHPSARIEGPALIGEGCIIGRDVRIKGAVIGPCCRVGEGARLEEAVLWRGVQVAEGALLSNCVAGDAASIGCGCHVPPGCIIGDGVRIEPESRLERGYRLWPDGWQGI
ncbi:MAG: NDP-sugar synthase [Chloroflexi bacterium]|nr:NDP-sugar synthase [Chloroflexota bacterium]